MLDKKSSFLQGPALAPPIIKNTLHDGSSNDFAENGINVLELIQDAGDYGFEEYDLIEAHIADLHQSYDKLILLGGDHSISYPIVKAMNSKYGTFDVLHIDAHSDLYHSFEGDPYSHACPFARIMEAKLCNRLVQVGIRGLNPHQRTQIEKFNVECIEMRSMHKLQTVKFLRPLYLSIDLDGFDPAFAPGVSHQESGGLDPRTVINFIQDIDQPIIGADIVELNPHRDHANITASLAAKLVKEVASKMV